MANRKRRTMVWIVLVLMATAASPQPGTAADMTPKPTMDFEFTFEASAGSIVSGIQEECSRPDCSDARPLTEGGPQRFECESLSCHSLAYSYSEYHRLKITFSDGVTRQSNVFHDRTFTNLYGVTVRETDLLVEQRWRPPAFLSDDPYNGMYYSIFNLVVLAVLCAPMVVVPGAFLAVLSYRATGFRGSWAGYAAAWAYALISIVLYSLSPFLFDGLMVTLAVEVILAIGYVLLRKRPAALTLSVVVLMNVITRPLLAYLLGAFYDLTASHLMWIAAGEIAVWLAEAGILALALRKQAGFLEAALLSLALNAASFGLGLLLPF